MAFVFRLVGDGANAVAFDEGVEVAWPKTHSASEADKGEGLRSHRVLHAAHGELEFSRGLRLSEQVGLEWAICGV